MRIGRMRGVSTEVEPLWERKSTNLGISFEQLALAVTFWDEKCLNSSARRPSMSGDSRRRAKRTNGFDAVRRLAHHHFRVIADA